jgi:hypothetical protein
MIFRKLPVILALLATILAGCSDAAPGLEATHQVAGLLKTDYENALPVTMQLALGSFKLDDSETPLTSEQAAALIPLWKAYRSLANGDGSSKEIEALVAQIQETFTQDQLAAIAGMQLTMQDLMQLAQEKNLALGSGGPNLSAEERATRAAQRFSGQGGGQVSEFRPRDGMGPPGGGPPGGGMAPGGEMQPGLMATPGARQTAIARRSGGVNDAASPALVEALITFLKTKTQNGDG